MEGEEKPSCRAREPEGENGGVQVLTEELIRRGLANVWGLIGIPGHLARIMIDSGDLVGDVVSEEFARQANLVGESCKKEIKTAATAGTMQIIGRRYPIKLRVAGKRKTGSNDHPGVPSPLPPHPLSPVPPPPHPLNPAHPTYQCSE